MTASRRSTTARRCRSRRSATSRSAARCSTAGACGSSAACSSVAARVLPRSARARPAPARASPARLGWVLSFAAPFALAGLFAIFLGRHGPPADAAGGPGDLAPARARRHRRRRAGQHRAAVRPRLGPAAAVRRRRAPGATPRADRRRRALLAIASVLAFIVWLGNPYTALLVISRARLAGRADAGAGPDAAVGARRDGGLDRSRRRRAAVICRGPPASPFGLAWTLGPARRRRRPAVGGVLIASAAAGCLVASGGAAGRARADRTPARGHRRGPARLRRARLPGGTHSALRR